ncbi:MAG: DNA mismatch repair endonuclease MutL [Thermodesulfobacteriota bacterium]
MGAVRLLSDQLINRIAAGEVIERPASVLKELVENSLDAGADRIEIVAEAGGRRMIQVADNGCGLTPDDLLLAVERHATSKLSEESDLLKISTLGFRGEALPSIGAVSRLTITSAAGRDGRGRRLRLSGGRLLIVEDAARDQGTTVEAADLFFNVPARRKFLKSVATEAAHLLETAQSLALSRPGLRLLYRHDGQELLSVSPREDDRTRLANVLGRETARTMFPFDSRVGGLVFSGFLGRPESDRSRPGGLYFFVNGRPVRDRLLTRAVLEAYRGRLAPGRYPVAVLFLEINPEHVDVNVHPAKAEVRFRRPDDVLTAALAVLGQALADHLRPLPGSRPKTSLSSAPETHPAYPAVAEAATWTNPAAEPPAGPFTPPLVENGFETEIARRPDPSAGRLPAETSIIEPGSEPAEPTDAGELHPVGQLFRSYILAQGPAGLYILDQHAAHERILFEKLRAELTAGPMTSQNLLFPQTFELSPTLALTAERLSPRLVRLGFDLTAFGGRTFVLRAVPAVLAGRDGPRAVSEIIEASWDLDADADPGQDQAAPARFEEVWLSSLACHAAVKAGQELSLAEMDRLLKDLAACRVQTNCPHGRPLLFLLERREIEKRFRRT